MPRTGCRCGACRSWLRWALSPRITTSGRTSRASDRYNPPRPPQKKTEWQRKTFFGIRLLILLFSQVYMIPHAPCAVRYRVPTLIRGSVVRCGGQFTGAHHALNTFFSFFFFSHCFQVMSNTQMKLINPETRETLPVGGVAGELCIRGPQGQRHAATPPRLLLCCQPITTITSAIIGIGTPLFGALIAAHFAPTRVSPRPRPAPHLPPTPPPNPMLQ